MRKVSQGETCQGRDSSYDEIKIRRSIKGSNEIKRKGQF